MQRHRVSLLAAALALASVPAGLQAPTVDAPFAPSQESIAARTPAPTDGTTTAPAPVRSVSTQQAMLRKVAHRGRARFGHARGAWILRKSGGRLVAFHRQ